jgi:hypothetical protein
MLTIHSLLVPRLRKKWAIPPLPPKYLAWHIASLVCVIYINFQLKCLNITFVEKSVSSIQLLCTKYTNYCVKNIP